MAAATDAAAASFTATQRDLAKKTSALAVAAWLQLMRDGDTPSPTREAADRWIAQVIPYILRARILSSQRARGYYQIIRREALPADGVFDVPGLPDVDVKALTSSLWVVGPQAYIDAGKAVDDIFSEERVNAIVGAVSRHAMNGGRDLIDAAIQVDPKATGYYRVEDGDPCYFCAMLMSRGAVFKEDSFERSDVRFFGPGDAKVHDHCGGSLAPAYGKEPFPADTKRFNDIWLARPKPGPGETELESFRNYYESLALVAS